VIDAARHHRGGGGGPSSSNPALVTPTGAVAGSHADLAALKSETSRAGKGSSPAVNIGGGTVSPATGGIARLAGVANRLPAPLLVALAAIAVLSVAGAMVVAFRRWPQLLRAPLRLLRR
jgi:hypothetical protein